MKVTKLFHLLLVALISLTACEQYLDPMTPLKPESSAEAVTVGFTMQGFSASVVSDSETKASTSPLPAGETVRVVIYESGATDAAAYCGENTYLVEAGSGARTLVPCRVDDEGRPTSVGQEIRLVPGKEYDIYTYSPAAAVETRDNRKGVPAYGDFLASKTTTTLVSYSPQVDLTSLQHELTKVVVKVIKDPADDGIVTLAGESITFPDVDKLTGSPLYMFDTGKFENSVTSESNPAARSVVLESFVQTNDNSFTAEAIIMPQTDPSTFPIELKVKINGQIYTFATPNTTVTFEPGKKYTWTITCKRKGVTLSPMSVVDWNGQNSYFDAGLSLSLQKPANTFMVAPGGGIAIPMKSVDGVPFSFENRISSAEVVWQLKNGGYLTIDGPDKVRWNADKRQVEVRTNPFVSSGNALIAAKAEDGEILWSWLVWVTPYDPSGALNGSKKLVNVPVRGAKNGTVHINNGGLFQTHNGEQSVMMDRNLGDMSPSDITANSTNFSGCYFQWGRKDPFVGIRPAYSGSGGNYAFPAPSYPEDNWTESTPTTFYEGFYDENTSPNWTRFSTGVDGEKSNSDPCPYGWRVPTSPWGNFTSNSLVDDGSSRLFYIDIDDVAFYRYGGQMRPGNSLGLPPYFDSKKGTLWYLPSGGSAKDGYLYLSSVEVKVIESTGLTRYGNQVRCIQDGRIFPLGTPRFSEVAFSEITATSFRLKASLLSDGGNTLEEVGFVWSAEPNFSGETGTKIPVELNGDKSISTQMTALTAGAVYYIRPYAVQTSPDSPSVDHYGDISSVQTGGPSVLTTDAITDITINSATVSGTVVNFGGSTGMDRGICYSTIQGFNPQTQGTKIAHSIGNQPGEFSIQLNDLSVETTYYCRAYARNSKGVSYGSQRVFVTKSGPTLAQPAIKSRTATSFVASARIISGRETITTYGLEWSPDPDFMTDVTSRDTPSSTEQFEVTVGNLTENGVYYLRTWCEGILGKMYSNVITVRLWQKPVVVTEAVSSTIGDRAVFAGHVESTGGHPITRRGFEYSTTKDFEPGTGTQIELGPGNGNVGSFSTNVDKLQYLTDYYVRTYTATRAGMTYGEQTTFLSSHNFRGKVVNLALRSSSFNVSLPDNLPWDRIQNVSIAYAHGRDNHGYYPDLSDTQTVLAQRDPQSGEFTTGPLLVNRGERYYLWVILTIDNKTFLPADYSQGVVYTNIVAGLEVDLKSNEATNLQWSSGVSALMDMFATTTSGFENTRYGLVALKRDDYWYDLNLPAIEYCWFKRNENNPDDSGGWFLPSAAEFANIRKELLKNNNNFPPELYDLVNDIYWTSNENGFFKAFVGSGDPNDMEGQSKSRQRLSKHRVRCVRGAHWD